MNDITIFLAQIFGPVLGFVGLGILLNQGFYMKAFKDLTKESFGLVMNNMAMIAIGVVLVMKHFLWGSLPEVLISLVGLAFLVKGALLAIMPKAFDSFIKSVLSKELMMFAGGLWLVGGAYLSYVGFMA
ncbi:hypothetical protein JW758_05635 [Candidatus Peregrinibacteria bacterium]|nr:hypothetical protein [Candidatus Peregrinibacteria bacterium]